MKIPARKSFRLLTTALGLACCLPAIPAWATNQFWDNKGTATPAAGTWDTVTADWVNSTTLTSSLVVFTNGNFANFTAGTANLASLVVTVNSVVTCAGLGTGTTDGIGANTVGTLTFSGTGSIGLTNGLQNINCDNTNLDIIFDVPVTGPGGFAQHGNGTISLVNSNTYAGGTLLTGGQVIYYYTNASFGTGPITNSGSPGSAIVNNTSPSAAITIPNNFYWASGNNNAINVAGGVPVSGQPGTTFSGSFNLNSGVTIINTSNNTNEQTLISGVVSGSGASLSVADDGVLQLGGTDTFNGSISISSPAVLSIVGSGSLDGGTYAGAITDSSRFIYASTAPQTLSGIISGTGSVTVTNNASLTLSGANTYTGNTVLYPGTLDVTTIGDYGGSDIGTGPLTMAGGTLLYTGTGDTTARTFNGVSGTTSTIDVPASTTVTLTGLMTGTAKWTVTKTDSGTLIIGGSQNNPYFGMNINGGLVILNDTGGSALGSTTVVNSGATLQLGSNGDGAEIYDASTSPLTVSAGGLFDLNGQNNSLYSFSLAGTGISDSGALINSASGTTATLTSPITLTAATTIGGITSLGNISLPGPISGFGMSLTYAGAGMLTLGGANSYSGSTIINAGTVDGNAASSIPGNVIVTETNLLELDNPLAMAPTAIITLSASAGVYLNFSGTQTISSLVIGSVSQPSGTYGAPGSGATYQNTAFSGSGILNVIQTYWDANGTDARSQSGAQGGGTGSWDDTSTNWWAGGNSDTNWTDGNIAFFAGTAGTVTLNASHAVLGLAFSAPGYTIINTDGVSTLSLGGITPTISVPAGAPTTISCALTGGGSAVGLNASGPGTLVLSGVNTYAGGTTIAGGTTVSVNTISDSGPSALGLPVTLGTPGGTGASLDFTGAAGLTAATVTFNGTTPSALKVPNGETLEFDGSLKTGTESATPVLTYNGGGTLIFGGAVDNSGLTMAVQQGELIINKASASTAHGLGGGASSVGTGTAGNSAEIQLSGSGNYDLYSSCVLTVESPDGMLDLNGQSDSMSTLTLAGTGPTGRGALINSAAGTTAVLANSGSGMILASNTLIGGSGSIALSGKISGASALTYAGAATLTLSNVNAYSGGTLINAGSTVLLTNSAAAAGTGPISLSGTLNVGIVGNNVILGNAISGSGTVNLFETTNDNLQLGGAMTNFTGLLNCPAGVGTSKAQILTTAVGISSAATINLAAGGTLYVANSGVNIACQLNIYGIGNAEPYGALRLESGALISGPVTLFGNTTMGNSGSGAAKLATISGVISNSGGVFGITFTNEPGTIVLSATNTYAGATTIDGGVLEIGGAGLLGGGNYTAPITNNATLAYATSAAQTLSGAIFGTGVLQQLGPGTLTLSGANTYTNATLITNGATLAIAGSGSLGNGVYAGHITNAATFVYASSTPQTLSGVISGSGSLIQSGSGTLTLSGANTYTGATTITNGGTLALAATGSINNSSSLSIAAGTTFDVSADTVSYTAGAGTTVKAAGTGIGVGTTAATINGGSSGTVTLGSVVLTFTPQTYTGDATHPALYLSQGTLALTGTGITVNNAAATPLGAGTYSLIQSAGGSLSVANTTVTVTGTGLAAGTAASLVSSGGSLNLVVTTTIEPVPVITSTIVSGNNLIFSGTNGTGSGTYHVLSSTNLALPLTDWLTIATNTFNSDGSFSITNAIGTGPDFFLISH
jgi:fibronectin-binding autotransporter adhesin